MNTTQLLPLIINLKTAFFIFLAFLIINLLIQKKTYSSNGVKKLRMIQVGALVMSLTIIIIIGMLLNFRYLLISQRFFGVITISRFNLEILLFSAISFELLYDFVLSKNKINFNNTYPYMILYGYPILMDILITNTDLGIITFITGIMYVYYLYEFINNKINTVIM